MRWKKRKVLAVLLIMVICGMQLSTAAASETVTITNQEKLPETVSEKVEMDTLPENESEQVIKGSSSSEEMTGDGINQGTLTEENGEENAIQDMKETIPGISYGTSIQSSGMGDRVTDGAISGKAGSGMKVEGFWAELYEKSGNGDVNGNLFYSAHVENIGWQEWKSDGTYAGTEGKSLQVEAIRVELTGEISQSYDVYYTVYVQGFGWFDWAKNGESAGTEGFARSIEAVRVCLIKKGEEAPGSQERPFVKALRNDGLSATAHIQNYGDRSFYGFGKLIGTTGEQKRMEALRLSINQNEEEGYLSGSIRYRVHVQNEGWQSWKQDGNMAGTSGKALRMEAIQIELTGELTEFYDVYYSVHVQQLGWLGWAKNGQSAGTEGFSYRMEALKICLVLKGNPAPGVQENTFYIESGSENLRYSGHVQNFGNTAEVKNNQILGTIGKGLRMEAVKIYLTDASINGEKGGIQYRTHVQNEGWQSWRQDGDVAGTSGKSLRMEAIQIRLTGSFEKYYDIYYRVHVQNFGWLGWAKNGQSAGTTGYAYRMEAIQIRLIPKGGTAPLNSGYYKEYTGSRTLNVGLTFQNPQYPNGCEAISLYMALRYYGYMLTTNDICYKYLPRGPLHSTNPYVAYMGDPGSITGGYGCWASVICQTATNYFKVVHVNNREPKNITGTSMEGLFRYIDQGNPVVVWGTLNMGSTTWFKAGSKDGAVFYWASRAHCVLLTGYDKNRKVVKVNDPIRGKVEYSFSSFERAYKTMNQNAMVILPKAS